jgi:hypothetical protein
VTAPTPEQAADWWVCDGPLPAGGQKITGPFATQELALTVRAYVEKAEGRTDLWVDDEAQEPKPAPELADSVECEACGLHRPPTQAEQFINEILLNANDEPHIAEAEEDFAIRYVRDLEHQAGELATLIAEGEPLSVKPSDDVKPAPELAAQPPSPQPDGTIVIGPHCFADKHREVISWEGENYYALANEDRVLAVGRIDDELAKLREQFKQLRADLLASASSNDDITAQSERSAARAIARILADHQTPGAQPGQQETNQEGTT